MIRRALMVFFSVCVFASCSDPKSADPSPAVDRFTPYPLTADAMTQNGAACIEDHKTELMWELKSDTPGLHDWRNTYTWFNPEESVDELDYRGTEDGGDCAGSSCDTWNFALAVNAEGHCGFRDWRMPTRDELLSITDPRFINAPPTADKDIFPHTQADEYWTGFDYAMHFASAWAWSFQYGHDRVDWKHAPKYVRLVRGTAQNLAEVKK